MTVKQKNIAKYTGALLLVLILCVIPLLSYADDAATAAPTAITDQTSETPADAAPAQPEAAPATTEEPVDAAQPAATANTVTTADAETTEQTLAPTEAPAITEEAETLPATETAATETATEVTPEPAATADEALTTTPETVAPPPVAEQAADTPETVAAPVEAAEPATAAETPAAIEEPVAENIAPAIVDTPETETPSPAADNAVQTAEPATNTAEEDNAVQTAEPATNTTEADDADTAAENTATDEAAVTTSDAGNRRMRAALALGEDDNGDARLAVATGDDDPGISNIAAGSSAKQAEEPTQTVRGKLADKPSSLTATGSDIIVEAYGLGVTREEALKAALIEAISKVNGTALTNTQVEELRYQLDAVLESFGDKAKTGGVSGEESLQWGSANQVGFLTNGLIKSYEVLSEGRLNKEYEINIRALVAKYTPGVETQRQRIAVMPFRILNADGWQAAYAEFFTQRLVDYLAQSNRFAVIDRKFMAEKHAEFDLLTGDDVPVAERVRIGNTLGADYMVVGQINKMEYWLTEEKLPYMKSMQYTLTARTSMTVRVIVPATGVITASKTYDEKTELKFDAREGLKIDDIEKAEIDKLAAAAARKAGVDILNEVFPIMAIAYSPEGIFTINQGGDTVKIGQKYNVRVYGEMLVDPYTKEELGRSEKTIGMVEITEVMPKFAFAKVLELTSMPDLYALVSANNVVLRPVAEQASVKTAPPPAKNQPKW